VRTGVTDSPHRAYNRSGAVSPPHTTQTTLTEHSALLSDKGVFFGGSSWKYPGWVGSIYSHNRYVTRGKFSKAKFEANCLSEYTKTFPTVGGDFSFYQFPKHDTWERIFAGTPSHFTFGLKVPEAVTVLRWPGHARYRARAGTNNESFLDASLFEEAFLEALKPYQHQVGVMMFEFGTCAMKDFATPEEFLKRLDPFLGKLPRGWLYGVEIRNKDYLGEEYFSVLKTHNVAHVINAWSRMPTIAEQIELSGVFAADHIIVRALLRHGRTYEQAVQMFEPYEKIQEVDQPAREAIRKIADMAVREKKRAYVFVNNRLEGNSPQTIQAIASDGPIE
jgi:uncharacterized protein YecE (DUF72 family)